MEWKPILIAACALMLLGATSASGESRGEKSPAATPAGVKSGFADVDGGKIFYEDSGRGDVIVLVHDGTLHREVWNCQFPVFAQDHRVVRYDRRGYGRSPMPVAPYSNVEDLQTLFAQLKIDRAILMGISAGGGLCMDFALKYPDKVTGLVLVGAVVSGLGYTEHMYTRGGRLTMDDYGKPEFMRDYWLNQDPYIIAPGNKAARDTLRNLIAANPQDLDDTKYQFIKGPDRPALPNLKEIAVPTIVMVGEYDIPDVHAHAGAIEAGISGAQRYVISDAGHLVPLEQADPFNKQALLLLRQAAFAKLVSTAGVMAAVKGFEDARAKDPEAILFTEAKIIGLGYQKLQAGAVDDAIELFKLGVATYPYSWNTYDSIGEAYAAKGNRDLAIRNYEKSLELNPDNANGKRALERLKGR